MKLLELRITLLDIQPPIWRSFLISPEFALDRMHRAIQVVMGWENTHLYRFREGRRTYADPQFGLETGWRDERAVRVGDLLSMAGSRMLYEYDFGDGWQHEIRCEGQVASDTRTTTCVVCRGGARACPPEDCGGPAGYAEILRALNGGRGRRYEELRAWVGGGFDPGRFSIDAVNGRLSRLFLAEEIGEGKPS